MAELLKRDPALVPVTISPDLLNRLVGAAVGISPDREDVEAGRAEIASVEAAIASFDGTYGVASMNP